MFIYPIIELFIIFVTNIGIYKEFNLSLHAPMSDSSHSITRNSNRQAIIAGAGPAGLTAAIEFLKQTDVTPVIIEADDIVGGLCRTFHYKGNRIDIGGHRFFSNNKTVTAWWEEMMPVLPTQSLECSEDNDNVMLRRNRVSRIYYLRKFFDYPITLSRQTFANMGLARTVRAGMGYLWSTMHKRKEESLEDFYINRFGKPLYSMFFEDYTEKVWGVHPSKLGADWGSQRVKGLSIFTILKDMLAKSLGTKGKGGKVETSLIEEFIYPKYGPGHLWETAAKKIEANGGLIEMNTSVERINIKNSHVVSVTTKDKEGKTVTRPCDYFLSSMPIKDLIASIDGIEIPKEVKEIASQLPYRDFMTVGLLVKDLSIKNTTAIKTFNNRVPDTWIYVQERDVKLGRIQVFNNWSPYMVADETSTMWIGLEYFCTEGDKLWEMSDDEFIKMAIHELEKIDIVKSEDVIDAVRIRMKKAYPAYYGAYYQLDKIKRFLDQIPNLFCIGRNGQHRYNNMDHSMLTAMEAVKAIKSGETDKSQIWAVNTEEEYHETKK